MEAIVLTEIGMLVNLVLVVLNAVHGCGDKHKDFGITMVVLIIRYTTSVVQTVRIFEYFTYCVQNLHFP